MKYLIAGILFAVFSTLGAAAPDTRPNTCGACPNLASRASVNPLDDACPTGTILYVKANASPGGNGASWATAFQDLQEALSAVDGCPGIAEIWVAAGIYKPTSGTDRTIYFVMRAGVAIYGGFPNTGNPGFAARDWNAYPTILSGDIGETGNADNSYHIIFNNDNGLDHTAILDGFTITAGGYATTFDFANGGGMYNNNVSPSVINCKFTQNKAQSYGGGMYNNNASPIVYNCIFSENSGGIGGAMYNESTSSPIVTNCIFTGNSASNGGGMFNLSSPLVSNCTFSNNSTTISGGGMYNVSSAIVTNCIFLGNSAGVTGGGMSNVLSSVSTNVINCTFSGNSATYGGGIYSEATSTSISNCIIWGNSSGIFKNGASQIPVSYSIVQGGYEGANNLNEDPLFVDQPPVGLGTSGDLHLLSCSPAINTGTSADAPATDFDGNARPFNGGFDMGAFEFQGMPESPTAVCRNLTVYLDEFGGATVQGADLDNGSTGCEMLSFVIDGQAQKLFTCDDAGLHSAILTVTDANNQSANCSATITVVDTITPVINCSVIEAVRNAEAGLCSFTPQHNDFNPEVLDNCTVTRLNDYNNTASLNGIAFPVGVTTVVWTAMDASGNTASCTVDITVIDDQMPTATCFDQAITLNGEAQIGLKADDLVDAADNCSIESITFSPAAISCESLGQTVPVTATVADANGNTATCVSQITVDGLPCGWSQNPDGVGCEDGSSIGYNPASGTFSVTSANCYYAAPYTNDALAYGQYELCGDGMITAQVTGIAGLGWAGITLRESNAPGAKKVQLTTNLNSNQSRREVRLTTGGQAYPQQFPAQGRYWLRLMRQGNQFVGYTSANGTQWFQAFAVTVSMNTCIQAGLVLSNYQSNNTISATFANVSVVQNRNNLVVAPAGTTPTAAVQTRINVYPNPTNGPVQIDLSGYAHQAVRIEVYDSYGHKLQTKNTDNPAFNLDLSGYPSGLYFIRLNADGTPDRTVRLIRR